MKMVWANQMFKDLCNAAVKLSRNPLGVICFTLLGMYAIAALVVIAAGVKDGWAIGVILAYPILSLAGFLWMVGWHHTKLYGPSDFSDEQIFIQFATGTKPTEPEKPLFSTGDDAERSVWSEGVAQGAAIGWAESPSEKGMEGMILNTLWTHQVNHAPTFESQWMFKLFPNTPVFLPFYQAVLRLVARGLVTLNHDGMVCLTASGWAYCKSRHTEFPPDDFFPSEPINLENRAKALAPPKPKPKETEPNAIPSEAASKP